MNEWDLMTFSHILFIDFIDFPLYLVNFYPFNVN